MGTLNLQEKKYIVTTKEICEILGFSQRRIQQLANEKALVRVSHGKWDLPSSIYTYLDYLLKREKAQDGELDKNEEEAKWVRAKRQKTELEVQIMQGELHRGTDVERVMNNMLGAFRARLLALPSKAAPQIVGKTDIMSIKEELKVAVYEALNELSDYDPYTFYENSKDDLVLNDEEEKEEGPLDDELVNEEEVNGRKETKK